LEVLELLEVLGERLEDLGERLDFEGAIFIIQKYFIFF